jgi:hypothetical protein
VTGVVAANHGGTGVANGVGSVLTLGAALTVTGTAAETLVFPNVTQSYTFPTAGGSLTALAAATTSQLYGGSGVAGVANVLSTIPSAAFPNVTTAPVFTWDGNTVVLTAVESLSVAWPWASGTVKSVYYYTAGSGTPTFTVAVYVNGSPVSGCGSIPVTSANTATSPGSTTCSTNSIASGQSVQLLVTPTGGTPSGAAVQVVMLHPGGT